MRKSTWTELFFDLAFVVTVAFLGHEVSANVTPMGILQFVVLFVPIWWAWVSFTFFSSRFDTDDLVQRLFTLLQIAGIVGLAIFQRDGLYSNFQGFALSYVLVRMVVILNYARVANQVSEAHKMGTSYVLGFTLALLPWILATLAPTPWRVALVALAMIIDIGTPWAVIRQQQELPLNATHIHERFGLFTIIVLAEGLAGIVRAGNIVQFDFIHAVALVFAVSIVFMFWWVYFENLDETVVKNMDWSSHIWVLVHLPLMMALILLGVGIEKSIVAMDMNGNSRVGPDFLFFAWAATMWCFSIIEMLTTFKGERKWGERINTLIRMALGLGLGLLALTDVTDRPVLSLGIVTFVGLLVIVSDIALKKLFTRR